MKKTLLCLCLISISFWSRANPVSETTAREAAGHFLWAKIPAENSELRLLRTYYGAGQPTLYVFGSISIPGFVIIAADDRIQPVLAYSTANRFEKPGARLSPELNYWLNGYSSQIETAVAGQQQATAQTVKAWQQLLNGSPTHTAQKITGVSPLLTTTWDQLPYYNDLCPAVPPGSGSQFSKAPTGCVATAMAQIMKYWGSPAQGVGTHTYSTSTLGGTLSADFGNATYNWANMPNTLDAGSTPSEIQDIALLMLHCGIAVDMDYTENGSGAFVISYQPTYSVANVEDALPAYFKYSSTLHGEVRMNYSDTAWINMLKTELDNGRPVLYAGFSNTAGHAFDFDGYDNNNLFHINWGWSGYGNGYYTVDNLEPSFVGTGGGVGNFNDGQRALFGIVPGMPQLKIGGDYVTSADSIIYNHSFSVATPINNIGASNFNNGLLALFAASTDSTGSPNGLLMDTLRTSIAANGNYTFSFSTPGMPQLAVGTYRLIYRYGTNFNDLQDISNGIVVNGSKTLTVYNATPPPSGIPLPAADSWKVYPNPADNFITLTPQNGAQEPFQATLTDLQGRTIWQQELSGSQPTKINVAAFAPGIYFLKIQSGSKIAMKKISIRHQ